ncbi:unnamed protein product [Enterobius vermicularis]|uniref:Mab-21 domain-containing protein n=1 Tax=Enterobius vermicularis TaxID=51028 RepID=A0A0N4UYJ2_ENTVE|nr:unnamed protein product [Enterobius vermicularis]
MLTFKETGTFELLFAKVHFVVKSHFYIDFMQFNYTGGNRYIQDFASFIMWNSIFCWQPVTPYLAFYPVPALRVVQLPDVRPSASAVQNCYTTSDQITNQYLLTKCYKFLCRINESFKTVEKESFLRKMRIVLQAKNWTNMHLRHQMPANWDQRYARQFCDLLLKDGRAPKKVDFTALSQCVRWIEAFADRLQEALERFRRTKDEASKIFTRKVFYVTESQYVFLNLLCCCDLEGRGKSHCMGYIEPKNPVCIDDAFWEIFEFLQEAPAETS